LEKKTKLFKRFLYLVEGEEGEECRGRERPIARTTQ
jgi:hypothetical protein